MKPSPSHNSNRNPYLTYNSTPSPAQLQPQRTFLTSRLNPTLTPPPPPPIPLFLKISSWLLPNVILSA